MKASVDELAIFGGRPAFPEVLHVGRPNIGDRGRLLDRINDLLDRRWLTNNGPYLEEFEEQLVKLTGVPHCVAMCNGTVALEIAIRAAGLAQEVIVPSFTFVATPHALQWQGITPVFCDVDPHTHLLDPCRVEELITPRTTGIIGVHLWGRPCRVGELTEIARQHGLRLLFDAAHAFGCSHQGSMIGGFGDAEVFSFHATKFVNSFEGGAVATRDGDLATRVRMMRNFGFVDYDQVSYVGTNGKMTEVAAAMGLTSLESMAEFTAANQQNYHRYLTSLDGIPGLSLLTYDEEERCNYQYVVLEVDQGVRRLGRDLLQQILQAENVFARRYFYPGCHRMEPYRSYFPSARLLLPQTERLVERVLSLPTGTAIGPDEIGTICDIVRFAVSSAPEITERLARSAPLEAAPARERRSEGT
ncbi:MAG: aminotransferase class I/II-fold pyridoxal phosphate-dependent enzyme [Gemmatimonadales bacterium]|nr:aminotransferase class I/II-fold pyridoxal phosphate-dependent enzyme [Gemmatimonadales bacterium]